MTFDASHTPAVDDAVFRMPKIDLHRHLEGSLRLDTLLAIAMEHDITLPALSIEGLRPHVQLTKDEPRTMTQFLSKFAVLRQFYRSEKIIRRVAAEVVADAAADNVRYLELRFTPKALNNIVNTDYRHVVTWVCEAANDSARQHNMDVRLIVSVNRHESIEIAMLAYEAAIACRDMGIVAIDLAGAEANYPPELFRPLFDRAKADGLNITIHAGEWAGADSVRSAVELGARRIGHGIRSIEDASVVDLLKERGIVLEVCPTSNVDSGSVESMAAHPLGRLHAAGVKTTINTDDPLISGITLSDELRRAMASFGFSTPDIRRQTLTAAESAFLPETERILLVNKFRNWLFPPGTRPLSAIVPPPALP